jgi:pyruvate dehydrogenase E2 component (dihydrolipoamide acetyltransferase)
MAQEFKLPDLGEGIHEGEIVKVLVQVGDEVKEDQPILEVETDKATVEIPSPFTGKVTDIRVKQGDLVHVGDVMLVVGDGVGAEAPAEAAKAPEPEREAPAPKAEAPAPQEPAKPARPAAPAAAVPQREGPVPASPSTRRLARELGVDLREVPPSGPGGRVTAQDVQAFAERGQPEAVEEKAAAPAPLKERPAVPPTEVSVLRPSAVPVPALPDFGRWGEVERLPLRSVRRSTAKHMALAWSQIPHVSHHDVADITKLEAFRSRNKDQIKEQGGSLTPIVFVLKAVVAALKAYPRFNSSLDADTEDIMLKKYYNIGIAADTDRGLVVPVIHDVDRKSVTELANELPKLVERVRSGEATLEEMQGGTFTITNIGPLGGTDFFPIVNYPEVAILGMARASWQPVVRWEEGEAQIEPRLLLPLILAFDHRVVDGADAARFMNMVIDILQDPDKLLMAV